MSSKTAQPHVLIVGAGLGGLTLAQCLRKRGISFEVFERDPNDHSRPQGWAIGLHTYTIPSHFFRGRISILIGSDSSILETLEASVPSDLPDLRASTHHLLPLTLKTQLCMYYKGISGGRIGIQDTPGTPVSSSLGSFLPHVASLRGIGCRRGSASSWRFLTTPEDPPSWPEEVVADSECLSACAQTALASASGYLRKFQFNGVNESRV